MIKLKNAGFTVAAGFVGFMLLKGIAWLLVFFGAWQWLAAQFSH